MVPFRAESREGETHPVLLPDVNLSPVLPHPQLVLFADGLDFLIAVVVPGLGEAGQGERREDDEREEGQSEQGERVPPQGENERGAAGVG